MSIERKYYSIDRIQYSSPCFYGTFFPESSNPSIESLSFENSILSVSWIPPSEAKGNITSFTVQWEDEGAEVDSKSVPSDETQTDINGAFWCAHYTVSVFAVNGCCDGEMDSSEIDTDEMGEYLNIFIESKITLILLSSLCCNISL